MVQSWRFKLREAEETLRRGQLDDARRLLCEPGLLEFLPAKQLMSKIASQFAARAEQRFAVGATSAGRRDLEEATRLGAEENVVDRVRQQFILGGLQEVETFVRAGDPEAAIARLEALEDQGAGGYQFRLTREAALKVLAAQRACQVGQFGVAEGSLRAAMALRPEWKVLEEIRVACRARAGTLRELVEKLHAALASPQWAIVLDTAEAILELCPEYVPALNARRRAWDAVGAGGDVALRQQGGAESMLKNSGGLHSAPVSTESRVQGSKPISPFQHGAKHNEHAQAVPATTPMSTSENQGESSISGATAPRFLLWVDGVGGYLVCRGDAVTLGQPVPGSYVDVPVLGDISRMHALIRRDGESYLIEPLRGTKLDGRPIDRPALLTDGREIELGDGVRMKFRLPNPLSRTARLDFVSRHRTQPTTDGILLMAESCVLGPGRAAHVVCRDWAHEVVLFSQGAGLHCRTAGRFTIDGVEFDDRAPISYASQIAGEDFSLSLERV